ncbi:hypothetical protein [Micromonospora endolithica]|uniref:SH3 domain-containing protein n=1 Tax=Micromonospora endolithica TaxID=230091 RepID=A0A3A9ZP13_9ACTN|nr:hypothetical protein [Micromonospora endolithica]RKN49227.1 hypothetical protein D7223_06885 [Micromonospora endolithica]TWJ23399.1 hypothetical protein JD76_03534 [Micromonospora endolithica]
MSRTPRRTRSAVLCTILTLVLLPLATPASAAPSGWASDLSIVDGDDVNVRYDATGLRLADLRPTPAAAGRSPHSAVAEGLFVATPQRLARPATRVRAEVTATVPSGATAEAQVRGWRDTGWTEWRSAVPAAVFDRPVTRVQLRVTLTAAGATARVRAVRLTADRAAVAPTAVSGATPGLVYRVYATRIGLVGEVTANGRTIVARDHFVALPSRRGLSPLNRGDYTVRVCTTSGSRCEYAPVWDVGPWNTRDDYWNISAVRENWKDLPRGRPEAQAAYQNGYNGGRDQFGRTVLNPAGIDLADGTFWDGLRLTTNAWVDVAYLWTGVGPRGVVGDGPLNIRSGASTSYPVRGLAARYANVPLQCYVTGQTVAGPYRTTNRWNRLATGQFVSHAYISAVYGGTVPLC